MPDIQFSPDYIVWFSDLKQRISLAHQKTSLTLNAALMQLYWKLAVTWWKKKKKQLCHSPWHKSPGGITD